MSTCQDNDRCIAIIGMAGRFPGANNIADLWSLLKTGANATTRFTKSELVDQGIDRVLVDDPNYVRVRGVIGQEDFFDSAFFGFNDFEARLMDPQARLLLECSWEALEDAGYGARERREPVSMYASISRSEYEHHLLRHLDATTLSTPFILDGTLSDFASLRVSHKLNLKGPSIVVKTACSSSLVAAHLACQGILAGEAPLAMVAAASIAWPPKAGRLAVAGSIFSRSGECRAFDQEADGIVSSDAVAAIVLKRLDRALDAKDHIYAIIRGSAVNNDGADKQGFAAPSVDGQAEVVRRALSAAGAAPHEIGYIEAHGSGTLIGDSMELQALSEVFGRESAQAERITIGSVKTNLGHTNTAAGLVGLIKTALCLYHRELVPTAGFRRPNPHFRLEDTRFRISNQNESWRPPKLACCHSTGMGGTNAHCVLEEAPPRGRSAVGPKLPQLLPISAKTPSALESASEALRDCLASGPAWPLADVAWTLQVGREAFRHRRCVVADSAAEAIELLTHRTSPSVRTSVTAGKQRPVAFLCPGLGVHDLGMAAALYQESEVFRRSLDGCLDHLAAPIGKQLRAALDAQSGSRHALPALLWRSDASIADQALPTAIAHPLLFSVELALADLWRSIGIEPKALLGYSLGEYVAATLAGVFSRCDAIDLVVARAQLIEAQPAGMMVAVSLAKQALLDLCEGDVEIAAENGARLCVVAGPIEAMTRRLQVFRDKGLVYAVVPARHPFHTSALAPVATKLEKLVAGIRRSRPTVPFLSNVTGDWITDEQARDPRYWGRHLCQTVEFRTAIARLLADQQMALLELGTGGYLSDLAKLHEPGKKRPIICSLESGRRSAYGRWLDVAGHLWTTGVTIEWSGLSRPETARRCSLPTYPFERKRHVVRPRLDRVEDRPASGPASEMMDVEDDQREVTGCERVAVPVSAKASESRIHGMRRLWQKAFGFEIADADNFFEIGGHSLLAIQLLFYVREAFNVELSIVDLRKSPTISTLTRLIDSRIGRPNASSEPKGHFLQYLRGLAAPDRSAEIERYIQRALEKLLRSPVRDSDDDDLQALGLDDAIPDLMRMLKHDLGRPVFPHELAKRRTAHALCTFVAGIVNSDEGTSNGDVQTGPETGGELALSRRRATGRIRTRNAPIAFILSSARSGSTLLRVMLAGHPALFCPPELHLLGYGNLKERRDKLKSEHFGRGLQRAFMELRDINATEAQTQVDALTARGITIKDTYAMLQELARPRLLVDKSPDYAEDIEVLRAADDLFSSTYYLVLVRHPYAVIESYVRNRIGAIADKQWRDPYAQAEDHWRRHYQNIFDFLNEDRRPAHIIRYEELVTDSVTVMRGICASLGIEYHEAAVSPYEGARMIDGPGDPNFHEHGRIDPGLIHAWRQACRKIELKPSTHALAERLGYQDV
jgi:phthiocerol/phenolphthiocerol synthesis type-I polyketide synthase E